MESGNCQPDSAFSAAQICALSAAQIHGIAKRKGTACRQPLFLNGNSVVAEALQKLARAFVLRRFKNLLRRAFFTNHAVCHEHDVT